MEEANFKEMYLTIMRASEEALDILIAAQRKCEAMYLAAWDSEEELEEKN